MCSYPSILRFAGNTAGAAQKGEYRVRGFGGVLTFPVVKVARVVWRPCSLVPGCAPLRDTVKVRFPGILAVLCVGTRQRKRCAAKKRAARGPTGQSARKRAKCGFPDMT